MNLADIRLLRTAGLIAGVLLIAACNNRLPAPKPVPGQPLTDAQLYEQKKQRYQEEKDNRRRAAREPNRRVEIVVP